MTDIEFNDLDVKTLDSHLQFFKPKAGKNVFNKIRIMPPWVKGEKYYKEYYIHYGLTELTTYGLRIDGWLAEPCLSDVGQKCPMCEIALEAQKIGKQTKNEELINLFKRIRKKAAHVANIVDMNEKDRGVQLYTFGVKVKQGLNAIFNLKGNITNPVKGRPVQVIKDESAGQSFASYQVMVDDVEDVSRDFVDSWRSQIKDLSSFPVYRKAEELYDLLEGINFGAVEKFKRDITSSMPKAAATPDIFSNDEDDEIDVDSVVREIQDLA